MKITKKIFIILFTIPLLSSCLGTKYLKENESLLYKQKINIDNKDINKSELEELLAQKPNRQFPLVPYAPYVSFYYLGLKKYDTLKYLNKIEKIKNKYHDKKSKKSSKIQKFNKREKKQVDKINKIIKEGNNWMKWGEPLSVYDSSLTDVTVKRLKLYLNTHGYFLAQVQTKNKKYGKRITTIYDIKKGKPYIINTTFVQSLDKNIIKLMNVREEESFLRIGSIYKQGNLANERNRITSLLQDNGYYEFNNQYITFEVDTAYYKSGKVAIKTIINQPTNGKHQVFTVESIKYSEQQNINDKKSFLEKVNSKNKLPSNKKSDLINKRILINQNALYSKTKTTNTQKQLNNLDHFKYVNVTYTKNDSSLTANIITSPLNRYQWTNELGINLTQGYPAPFYNISFKNRDFFKGFELFEINGRIGFEGVAAVNKTDDVFTSVEAGFNMTLTYPDFKLPIGNSLKKKIIPINPKTKLTAGYTYTRRPEYIRKFSNFSTNFSWDTKNDLHYKLGLAEISLIDSEITSKDFLNQLETLKINGNRIINTFNPSLVTSASIDVRWDFGNKNELKSNSSFIRGTFESGGTLLNLIDKKTLKNESMEFFKFIKFNIDFRHANMLSEKSILAYRIKTGIAYPYGEDMILPYEKYYFIGGSNSIRAWRPRRLGPGEYVSTKNGLVNYDSEQTGEVIFESSIELREKLVSFIDYAFFVDVGNIWTLEKDIGRPGSEFKINNFFKQIAVGGGIGLRFDFSFVIVRLDTGLKIYDPAREDNEKFVLNQNFYNDKFTKETSEPFIINIGIGYPF